MASAVITAENLEWFHIQDAKSTQKLWNIADFIADITIKNSRDKWDTTAAGTPSKRFTPLKAEFSIDLTGYFISEAGDTEVGAGTGVASIPDILGGIDSPMSRKVDFAWKVTPGGTDGQQYVAQVHVFDYEVEAKGNGELMWKCSLANANGAKPTVETTVPAAAPTS